MLRKRKKPLITNANTKSKLHSNSKSTYFYSNDGELSDSKPSCDNSTTDFRWASSHCEQYIGDVRMLDFANRTQPSREKKSYSRIARGRTSYILPAFCSIALLLVIGLAINPMVSGSGEEAYAADQIPGEPGYGEDTTNASIELSVGNNNLSNAAAKAGEVNYLSTTVNVKATDVNGYKMYVQAAPGSSATLTNAGVTVDGVGSKVATADFGNNKWGYALDETGAGVESLAYSSVPENGSVLNPAYTTDVASEEKNFNLVFAAKFATDAPAGHYGTNVLLSVAVDAETVGGFYNIEYMQDMTNGICSRANENDTKQLIDKRDNKKYWVTKLRDGNCWMTQNLDLDIPASGLTAALSDMETDWNSSSAYPPVETQTSKNGPTGFNSDYNVVASYDPGLRLCSPAGCTDDIGDDYDSHYLSGNYYSWTAAKAGIGSTNNDSSNKQSICPKNWAIATRDMYYAIKGLYSLSAEYTYTGVPIYFATAGRVEYSSLYDGGGGYYWTGTNFNTTGAYYASIGANYVNIDGNNDNRYFGCSIRCVAR